MSVMFTKLEIFTGEKYLDVLLRSFESCCLIADKQDDLVKGQSLLLFVAKQVEKFKLILLSEIIFFNM